jgi:hypothetical protein
MFLLAADQGIFHGNLNAADIFFLIATIVFAIALIFRLTIRPIPIDGVLIATGFVCVALAWLLL